MSQIRNGAGYLSRHLSANDYYSEGERVEGYWLGKGAKKLGLKGAVEESEFEALRTNRHPFTGGKLTPRSPKVAFHDIVLSAPKSFSIAAIVGQDERLVAAFHESSRSILAELEKHAAVRVRSGEMVRTEAFKTTGNVACAVFHHDSSRMLGPQLHTHLVISNATFDEDQLRWMALQPRIMLEASKQSIRRMFHDDLANRARDLGYNVIRTEEGFRIDGISQGLEDRYSQRSGQRRKFEQRYRDLFKRDPGKDRIEAFIKDGKTAAKARFAKEFEVEFRRLPTAGEVDDFVKDWRSASLKKTSTAEVRRNQLNQLSAQERQELESTVANARKLAPAARASRGHGPEQLQITAAECHGLANHANLRQGTSEQSSNQNPRREEKTAASKKDKMKKTGRAENQRRQQLLRRMKQGTALAQAVRGRPAAIIARTLRNATRP